MVLVLGFVLNTNEKPDVVFAETGHVTVHVLVVMVLDGYVNTWSTDELNATGKLAVYWVLLVNAAPLLLKDPH